ncbi:phage portal protein [Terrihabitans sp. B22-R8]|uniref:phage portal protein n=1 Tax=Terrihabitans sp. B22-R8 TaxID=3425128 RepID=UPI00403D465B
MNLRQKAVYGLMRLLRLQEPSGWRAPHQEGYSGETVTDSSVLALSAAWACVNLLAGTISSLPLMVYRTDAKGVRKVARDHSLYRILHDSPNADQTAVDFLEFLTASIELRGNGYAEKQMIGNRLIGLVPISPDNVTVRRLENGRLEYRWTADGKSFVRSQSEVLHIRGFGGAPEGGLSTLAYGRHVFGLSQAIDKSAGATFRNGLRPSVQIGFQDWLTPEQRKVIEELVTEKYAGALNAGKPFITEGGTTLSTISLSPEDAQMLESRGFSVEEICRFFGVPPFMIGHTEKTTNWGTGLSEQTLGFQKFTLRRRLKRIEMALEKQLLTADDRAAGITIEFSVEGLLRGDSKARAEFYRTMTQIGVMTINEVRALENMPPVEGGDVPRMQSQNIPITEAAGIGHNGGPSLEDAA